MLTIRTMIIAARLMIPATVMAGNQDSSMHNQNKLEKQRTSDSMQSKYGTTANKRMNRSTTSFNQSTIRTVQQKLNDNGHEIAVDGIMGNETRQALRDYQGNNALDSTGDLNSDTLASLGVQTPASTTTNSNTTGTNRSQTRQPASIDSSMDSETQDEFDRPMKQNEDMTDPMEDDFTEPMDTEIDDTY